VSDALTVRRYESGDADAVWAVHERALRASPVPFVDDAPADDPLRDIAGDYLDGDGEFLVGTVDGTVVAVGGFRPGEGRVVETENVRVDPDYRGRGYGARMLAEAQRSGALAPSART